MTNNSCKTRCLTALLVSFVLAGQALGAQVQDLVRIKGAEGSKLVGTGLVVGLPGSGDGKNISVTLQVAELLKQTSDPTVVASALQNLKNVALVALSVTVPAAGVREGDQLDVYVSSLAGAKSLKGGRLFLVPMLGPIRGMGIFAFAEGPVTIESDDSPTAGVVKQGAQMVRDVRAHAIKDGKLTLVLNNAVAGWPMAAELASLINSALVPDDPDLAIAVDPKNVVIEVPEYERANPANFINEILNTRVYTSMVNTGAVVAVNEKAGTIVVDGEVEIAPIVVRVKGLTITVVAPQQDPNAGAAAQPQEQPFIELDPSKRGGAKLKDLLAALNQLNVEVGDCIALIREIHKSGKLYARLIEE
jgi:flagellar P-ring protein precursor FlgI